VDLRLQKDVRVRGRQQVGLFLDVYNVFNFDNFNYQTFRLRALFHRSATEPIPFVTYDARRAQLGLRLLVLIGAPAPGPGGPSRAGVRAAAAAGLGGVAGRGSDCRPASVPPAPGNRHDGRPAARTAERADARLRRHARPPHLRLLLGEDDERGERPLAPDRLADGAPFSSVAAVGFALTAYPIGVERGCGRARAARDRALTHAALPLATAAGPASDGGRRPPRLLLSLPRHGDRAALRRVELSTIDTALLLAGAITCREYFDRADDAGERELRALADSLYRRVDWRWATAGGPLVRMGWRPDPAPHQDAQGFIVSTWHGYMEAMLLYALALGSPTHPIDAAAWPAWTRTYRWERFHGEEFVQFAPMFGHQYSQRLVRPSAASATRTCATRRARTRAIDYFENSRRATLVAARVRDRQPGPVARLGPTCGA
jgi:hypothetical protein